MNETYRNELITKNLINVSVYFSLTESFPRLDMDPKDSSQKRDQGGSVVNARLFQRTTKIIQFILQPSLDTRLE